jgi:tripartite-type tricarboxylate transporter receptor subunit TctC
MERPRLVAAIVLFGFAVSHAAAQYPSKPLRIVIPFPSGGLIDSVTRAVGEPLSRSLGQPVIVDPKPGADGQIAAMEVRRAAADGYTLFVGATTPMSMVPALRKDSPYDVVSDFTPISSLGAAAIFVFAHPSVPATSLKELVSYAQAYPAKLSYASGHAIGIASTAHFLQHAKIRMLHVPYKGESAALPDLITGRVQLIFATPHLMASHVKDGRLRALAALLPQRSAILPDVPTMKELAFPEVPVTSWAGFFGPASLPRDITERLSRELNAVLARPNLREEIDKRGFMIRGSGPDELAQVVKTQLAAWRSAVAEGWIQPE